MQEKTLNLEQDACESMAEVTYIWETNHFLIQFLLALL